MTISATRSSTTLNVSRNVRTRSGSPLPARASAPSANAVSLDMDAPQPWALRVPALNARKMAIGTTMPASPAITGSVSLLRARSSPTSSSRRASSPTTRKKKAIRPELTNARRFISMSNEPADSRRCVAQAVS